ncbi:hypothetical protein SBADM41S_10180 [Streptomyces badius]
MPTRPTRIPRASAASVKRFVRRQAMRAVYRTDLRRPLDPDLAVYGAYWNRGVACNPAAIHAKARELVPHIRGVWVVSSRHRDRMPAGCRTSSRARVPTGGPWPPPPTWSTTPVFPVVSPNDPVSAISRPTTGPRSRPWGSTSAVSRPRPEDRLRQDPRARTPVGLQPLRQPAHHRGLGPRYPAPEGASYEHLDLGYPRNDVYFTATADDIAKVRAELGIAEGQIACSTPRPTATTATASFPTSTRSYWRANWARITWCWCAPTTSTGGAGGLAGLRRTRSIGVAGHRPAVEDLRPAAGQELRCSATGRPGGRLAGGRQSARACPTGTPTGGAGNRPRAGPGADLDPAPGHRLVRLHQARTGASLRPVGPRRGPVDRRLRLLAGLAAGGGRVPGEDRGAAPPAPDGRGADRRQALR